MAQNNGPFGLADMRLVHGLGQSNHQRPVPSEKVTDTQFASAKCKATMPELSTTKRVNIVNVLRTAAIYVLFGLLILTSEGLVNTARAHSFNVVLLLPADQISPASKQNILDGFRLATRERDGHDNEESDGHLGGLDVYISSLEISENEVSEIPQLVSEFSPDIVAVLGTPFVFRDLLSAPGTPGAAMLSLPEVTQNHAEQYYLAPSGSGTAPFAIQFEQDYSRSADDEAGLGYVAGRIIDQVIRALGSARDKPAMTTMFAEL